MEQSESATGYAPDGGADGSASSSGRTMKAADAGPLDKLASFLEVQRKDMVPMFEMCLLMFLWGLANNLNDILIKQFKKAFELGNLQAVSAHAPVTQLTHPRSRPHSDKPSIAGR